MNKIFILIPTLNIGGAEKFVVSLANNLPVDTFKVYLILYKNENKFKNKLNKNIIIETLTTKKNPFNFVKAYIKFKLLVSRHNPNIIQSNFWGHYTFPILSLLHTNHKRINLLATIHSTDFIYTSKKINHKLYFSLEKYIYQRFQFRLIGVSRQVQFMIKNKFPFCNSELVYNGIPMSDNFSNDYISLKNNTKFNYVFPTLIHIGNYSTIKRQIDIIDACNLLSLNNIDFKLFLIGKNIKKNLLKRIIEYNLSEKIILFENCVSVNKILKLCDIGIFPSIYEGFGFALVEMMYNSLPIISSNIPINKEITNNGECSLYVDIESPIEIYESIVKLIKDTELYSKLSYNSKKIATENFNLNYMINNYIKIYNN